MPDADHIVPTHEVTRQRQALLLLTTVLAVVMHWLYATAAGLWFAKTLTDRRISNLLPYPSTILV